MRGEKEKKKRTGLALTTIHDGESAHNGGLRERGVGAGHGEADGGLEDDAERERVARADPVADEGAEDRAGQVEQVDDGVPAEYRRQRRRATVDIRQDRARVYAERVRGELVKEVGTGVS